MKNAICIVATLLAAAIPCRAGTIYVDDNAAGANNGSSWANAYKYLQDALADANSSPKPVEIRVAQGTYRPDESTVHPNGTGDREATFGLITGVALKGSYAGFNEPDPNAQDRWDYRTVLGGYLDAVGSSPAHPEGWYEAGDSGNSYHVVTGSGTDETAVLSEFEIVGGRATISDSIETHSQGELDCRCW